MCGGFTKEDTENLLIDLDFLGIDNVVALRGDALKNETYFRPEREGNEYATDLVLQINNLNKGIYLDEDFLTFEHTDGLNYITVEVNRFDTVDNWIGFSVKNIDINLTEGIGVGVLYPKTNTQILGNERYDEFHVAGFGMSAHLGLDVTFFKYFFIQYNFKAGYINMQDIRTTANKVDSAAQHFTFFENMWVFGGKFSLTKNKK